MAEINDLNVTDASNTARFPEAMAPSAVNDGARALEGLVARWHENINTSIATTGSSNAYVLAAKGTQVLFDGLVIGFDANHACTGASTLNVDATGVKNILKHNDVALASGDIEANQKVVVVYDGTSWQMISPLGNAPFADPTTTRGDIMPRGASSIGRLAIGSANTVLQSDGTDPAWGTVASAMIAGGAVATAKIADDAVTLSKMASGTDGVIITYDASGNPTHVGPGSDGQVLTSTGAGSPPAFEDAGGGATAAAMQASTSGTSIDFTGIPSGTIAIDVIWSAYSCSTAAHSPAIQIGDSGGVETSGYLVMASNGASKAATTTFFETMFDPSGQNAGNTAHISGSLRLVDPATNTWIWRGMNNRNEADIGFGAGTKSLSAELDRVRFTTAGGDTLSAGKTRIIYW